MIYLKFRGVIIEIHFLFVAIITLSTLIDETGIALLGLIASLIHECGHIMAFVLLGHKIEKLSFEISGIALKKVCNFVSFKDEIIVTISGCLVNALIFIIGAIACGWNLEKINMFSAVNLVIGTINIFPMSTLDGGRTLELVLGRFCKARTTQRLCFFAELAIMLFFLVLSAATIYLGKINFSFLILTVYLIFMVLTS